MKRWLAIVLCCVATGAGATELQKFTDCRLVEHPDNDGDSFRVKTGDRELYVRLYFVDCPEATGVSDVDAKRVRDQARYFGLIDPVRVVHFGKEAKAFAARTLEKPFTIQTSFASAMGRSAEKRVYTMVTTADGKDLASVLVANGLARAFGVKRSLPDGTAAVDAAKQYAGLEQAAMSKRAGIWAESDAETLVRGRAEEKAEHEELTELRVKLNEKETPSAGSIDLNKASRQELQSVSGIGPSVAANIIAGRPYKSVEELRRVSGVGPKLYAKIAPLFVVKEVAEKPEAHP